MDETNMRLGEISREGDLVVLRYRRDVAHPPEKVWRALTESEHLKHWFPADIIGERVAGAELKIAFWPESIQEAGEEIEASGLSLDDAVLPGRLLTWEPPSTFEFTWDSEHLRFDLEPVEDGTRLLLTVRTDTPSPRGYASTATGYHVCLNALTTHLAGGHSSIFDPAEIGVLEEAYAEMV